MQTKRGSVFEVSCNVFSGLITSYITWLYMVIPIATLYLWNLNKLSFWQIFVINGIFTVVSIVRGYFWRRLFNWLEQKNIVK